MKELEQLKAIVTGAEKSTVSQTLALIERVEVALAQPEQEPVAWINIKRDMTYLYGPYNADDLPLYTKPPQRKPMTMQPIIKDPRGVLRFKKNGLVDALHEHGVKTGLGLNELHCMEFTDEDRQQFAQLIGYSVGGYSDLSYVTDEAYEAAEQAAHGIKE